MKNLSPFCTCADLSCPLHPANHERGCAPCIADNLKDREIPNCFFHLADQDYSGPSYTFEDFARSVTAAAARNRTDLQWEPDFTIRVGTDGQATTISANKAGLQSLANHLLQLAEGKPGDHLHLDPQNSLEDGSTELIIERIG